MSQLPTPILDELRRRKDFSLTDFIAAHETALAVSIRLHPNKAKEDMFPHTTQVPWNTDGRYLAQRPVFTFDPLFHAGAYYVQEASSMFIGQILQQYLPQQNAIALDLCAAPGGKSTLLASQLPDGLVVANEVIKSRANILSENVTKWGTGNIIVTNNDPKQLGQLSGFFDLMLIDAPCSGSGLFRREKEWREEWTEENVTLCSQRQQRIVADAFASLKTDGILIYSTCSYSSAEDEDIADWICDHFDVESLQVQIQPEWGIEETISAKGKAYGYRFFPHLLQGEGFFVTVFRKKTLAYPVYDMAKTTLASKEEKNTASKWLSQPEDFFFFKQNEDILVLKKEWQEALSILQKHLYLKKAGTNIGQLKIKGLVPAHDLAVSTIAAKDIATVELSEEDALKYLRKQDFELPDQHNGWLLATYKGLGLGWMKILPNRINNYYPTEWRILKS